MGTARIRFDKSTETLFGRRATVSLDPLDVLEIDSDNPNEFEKLWLRGGLPASFGAASDSASFELREKMVETLVDREFANEGIRIDPDKIHKLCVFLAYRQGEIYNVSMLAKELNINRRTVVSCIDMLFFLMVGRKLDPFYKNFHKRLVKTPRFYYRDSGLLHQLLDIKTADALDFHPIQNKSWKGFVIENILRQLDDSVLPSFYRHPMKALKST